MTNGVLDRDSTISSDDCEGLDRSSRSCAPRSCPPGARDPTPSGAAPRGHSSELGRRRRGSAGTSGDRRRSLGSGDREAHAPEGGAADLLGARALAWAGGIVTLLGVVFFFVLAVNRGWIGPVERVGLGALASVLLLAQRAADAAALRPRCTRRSPPSARDRGRLRNAARGCRALRPRPRPGGPRRSPQASPPSGPPISLAWRSEIVASIGLVGATVVPVAAVFDGGITRAGNGLRGPHARRRTAVVAIRRGWECAPGRGRCRRAPAGRVARARRRRGRRGPGRRHGRVLLAARARRRARPIRGEAGEAKSLSISFVLASALLAGTAARVLFERRARRSRPGGSGARSVALAYLGASAAAGSSEIGTSRRCSEGSGWRAAPSRPQRCSAAGRSRSAWARRPRCSRGSPTGSSSRATGSPRSAYLGLAGGHALGFDAPPSCTLRRPATHPAADALRWQPSGSPALGVAHFARRWQSAAARGGRARSSCSRTCSRAVQAGAPGRSGAGDPARLRGLARAAGERGRRRARSTGGGRGDGALGRRRGRVIDRGHAGGSRRSVTGSWCWRRAARQGDVVNDSLRLDAEQSRHRRVGPRRLASWPRACSGERASAWVWCRSPRSVAGGGAVSVAARQHRSEGFGLPGRGRTVRGARRCALRRSGPRHGAVGVALGLALVASALLLEHTELVAAWAAGAVVLAALAELTRERRLQLGAYALCRACTWLHGDGARSARRAC